MGSTLSVRVALRQWRRTPWFTLLAASALGVGIGVNNTFFALTNAAVLRGLPIANAHEVMFVGSLDGQSRVRGLSYADFQDIRQRATTLSSVAAFFTASATVTDPKLPPDSVATTYISSNGFTVAGRPPVVGRNFVPDDDRPGAPAVVLSDHLWNTRYQRDPRVVGRSIIVNGQPSVIVGVAGAGFRFPGTTDLWIPLASQPATVAQARTTRTLSIYGRLSRGSTRAMAQNELGAFAGQWTAQLPAGSTALRTTVVPINDQMVGRVTDLVWLTFLTVGALVLLIACANVANLLLMRGTERTQELAIRVGLGATRGHVLRQLLAEGAMLALAGGAVGLVLSLIGLRGLSLLVPPEIPFIADLRLDGRVMTVLLLTSLGSVVLFGLAPACLLSSVKPGLLVADGGRVATRGRQRSWVAAFLAVEFALTFVLACSVVLGMRLNRATRAAQFEFDTSRLFTASITLPPDPYQSPGARTAFYDRLIASVAGHSAIEAATVASAVPGGGGPLREVHIEGRVVDSRAPAPEALTAVVGAEYFRVLDVPLLRGRMFVDSDQASVVVNQRFVDLHFPAEDPLGRLIRMGRLQPEVGAPSSLRIVGVAPSIRQQQQGPVEPHPVVYVPRQALPPTTGTLLVRTKGAPEAIASTVRAQLHEIDPNLPLTRAMTLDNAVQQVRWIGQVSNILLYGVGASALVLALVGLYAVTASSVRQRRREIGIRMAVGATPAHVLRLILAPTSRMLGIGLAAGVACTVAFDRLFTTTEMRLTDASILLPTLVAMITVALAACVGPVLRAQRLDPATILRQE